MYPIIEDYTIIRNSSNAKNLVGLIPTRFFRFSLDKKRKHSYNEYKLNERRVNYDSFYKAGTKIKYS